MPRPKPSISVLLATLISTALVCLIGLSNAAIANGMQEAVRTATGGASLVVTPAHGSPLISPADADQVAATPGVDAVDRQLAEILFVSSAGGNAVGVQTLGPAARVTITEGRAPQTADEVLFVALPSKPLNAPVGGELQLQDVAGESHTVHVVGVATTEPGAVEEQSLPTLFGTAAGVQSWSAREGYTRLHVSTSDPDAAQAKLDSLGQVQVEPGAAYVEGHMSDYAVGARTVRTAARVLAAVVLLAALVAIMNTYSIKATQRTRQLALLRCLGATRKQVFRSLMREALVTGVAGALAGLILGHLLAALIIGALPVGVAMHFVFSSAAIGLGLVTGVLACVLAAVPPARRATRVAPIEALRDPAPSPAPRTGRTSGIAGVSMALGGLTVVAVSAFASLAPLAFLGGVISAVGVIIAAPVIFPAGAATLARLGGSSARDAAATLCSNPRRTGAVSLAVWLGMMLITSVLVGSATASASLGRSLDQNTPTDIIVELSGPTLTPQIDAMPQVAAIATVDGATLDATMGGRTQQLSIVGWTSQLPAVMRNPNGVPKPRPGTIQLPSAAGAENGDVVHLMRQKKSLDLTAVIVPNAPGMGIVTPDDLARIQNESSPGLWVRLVSDADPQEAVDAITRLAGPDVRIDSPLVMRAEIDEKLRQVSVGTTALLGAVILIVLVSMANTLSLSVLERTREIGLLRALGSRRAQVQRMIRAEALLTTCTATVLGVAFGIAFGIGGVSSFVSGEQIEVVPALPWLAVLGVLVASIPAGLLASAVPARRAASIPPIAALANAE